MFSASKSFGMVDELTLVTHLAKRRRQLLMALRHPAQQPRRIAHRRRLEQLPQIRQKRRIRRRHKTAAGTFAPHFPVKDSGSRKSFRPRPIVLRATSSLGRGGDPA